MEFFRKYRIPIIIICLILIGVLVFFIVNHSRQQHQQQQEAQETPYVEPDMEDEEEFDFSEIDNGIAYDEEAEGTEIRFKSAGPEDFYGSWEAKSGQSVFMYGNVDLTINPGGTWTGNVVDEDMAGTWDFKNGSMHLKGEYLDVTLSFSDNGKLIMQEDREGDGEMINTVLTKK